MRVRAAVAERPQAPIRIEEIEQRLNRPENARVGESLRDIDYPTAVDLLSTYAGRGPDLAGWLKGAAINTDRDLRLQYLAGMGVNVVAEQQIYLELMAARRFPDGLFVASAETLAMLRDVIGNTDHETAQPR